MSTPLVSVTMPVYYGMPLLAAAQVVFILSHLAAISALGLVCYVSGRRALREVAFAGLAEEIGLSTALGLGALGVFAFVLGMVGALTLPTIATLVLLLQLPCLTEWRTTIHRIAHGVATFRTQPIRLLGVLIVIVAAAPLIVLALYPPTAFDAIMYHLPIAEAFAANHQIVLVPELRFTASPQLNNLLFSIALLAYDDLAAQLIQVLLLTLSALLVYALGQRCFSQRAGALAAAAFLAQPLVIWVGTVAYGDISEILFVFAFAFAIQRGLTTKDGRWLALAGIYGGFAAGTKYQALLPIGFAGVIVLLASLRERRWRWLVAFGLPLALVAAPWYIRNALQTGNPVYPALGGVFGYGRGLWDAQDVQSQNGEILGHGFGRSLRASLLLPLHLIARQRSFSDPGEPLFLPATVPIIEVLILVNLRERTVRWLAFLVAAFGAAWFASFPVLRYLLPALPFALIAAAGGADRLLTALARRYPRLQSPSGWERRAALPFLCLIIFAPGWLYAATTVAARGTLPTTVAQRDAYFTRELPLYPAYQHLNQGYGSGYALYALYAENMAYFAHGTVRGDWFGPARYRDLRPALTDGAALYNALIRQQVDTFLVARDRYPLVLPTDDAFTQHFRLVYADEVALIFVLTP